MMMMKDSLDGKRASQPAQEISYRNIGNY